MYYDITTVNQLPAIAGRLLVTIRDLQSDRVQLTPQLVCDTAQMTHTGDGCDDEAIGPGALFAYIKYTDVLTLMVL
ncbi:hypothetical protein SDC9_181613 [bioreactor metagenome]|uniref:Uncharacterized protein n=1 Tax=bioreactor metagenome TaxID=1076179 RepID=A0A645H602_9ZZZZ